ncbi:DUF2637 domain-containing protein [Streptomyces sp. SID4928]|uniref:DUF2637 domain-containing protein n=1 Tax=unclassified Streptomyces TaxID=2593676 RepID=UPI0001C19B54|nr:DUF2637 domain-containing protein [Streptomyces sp. ACT-1]EGE41261.1 hypothetical protein SACT1_1910 [Streptomyces sp. ACT-1]MYR49321.1 DUF2637 domain-containing protein [Streptomyces sp. SID4928]
MTSPSPAPHPADRYVLLAAGAVILALTAVSFWLSYAHLAEVAGEPGLGNSPARMWAWPAALDAFLVAGELLMLRAGLRRRPDWWAIALTATGSLGSIALNVAGVTGTRDPADVPVLDYVVAAVPPTAALLAFGVLMHQIHQHLGQPNRETNPDRLLSTGPAVTEHLREGDRPRPHPVPAPSATEDADRAAEAAAADEPPVRPRKVGRPPTGELDEFGPIVEQMQGEQTRKTIRATLRAAGHTISNERLTELVNRPDGTVPKGPFETPADH